MLIALIVVTVVAVLALLFAGISTVLYLATCDKLHEAEARSEEKIQTLVDAGRAVIPLLPNKSVDSFYAEGSFTERQALRQQDMSRNAALDTFLKLFKPAQSLTDSAKAYERVLGYSSAAGVAAAEQSPTGTWAPSGSVLKPGPLHTGPRYDLEET